MSCGNQCLAITGACGADKVGGLVRDYDKDMKGSIKSRRKIN